jgi:hypothetical protein
VFGLLFVTNGLVTRARVKELPASGQRVLWWWRKRRLVCGEADCPRLSFAEAMAAVSFRSRLMARLRAELAEVIAGSNRR